MAFRGEGLETDVPQKKQTAATDSMEGISPPLRDDGRVRRSGRDAHSVPVLSSNIQGEAGPATGAKGVNAK